MELISIPYPPLATLSSSRKHSFTGQPLILPNIKRYPDARKLKFTVFKAQTSESLQGRRKSNLTTATVIKQEIDSKDDNLVFVAGATGKVGSRTVRELLKLGFQVRAGVRSAQKAKSLVQSVQQMKLDDGSAAVEKLKIVECDLERDRIEPAIGNASVVICCIGASEKEVFDITGPYRIDYKATKTLIDAATVAEVNHFILLTSLGTNKVGFPAAILNLFWGVLIWKRKAEEVLIASGLPYTIVRPGGMERPTDAYKETHNIFLAKEDTLFGGQVSNLQVAEIMAFMAKNRSLSYCKVVEVIAETTAPLTPMGELLTKIPSQRVDGSLPTEPQSASTPDPAPSQTVSEAASSIIDKKPTQTRVQIAEHLSPYIAYPDLKPPSSPTPTPSTSQGSTKARDVNAEQAESKPSPSYTQISPSKLTIADKDSSLTEMQKTTPLSPYIVYDDLKPPTSPTPTASSSTKGHVNVVKAVSEPVNAVALYQSQKQELQRQNQSKSNYEDLKPPTSPSPNAQTVSLLSTSPVSDAKKAQPSTSGKPVEKQQHSAPKPGPLSPFTMYEDLKPPTSPIPSPRKC